MKNSLENRIDDYHTGKLSPEESRLLEREMENDAEMAKEAAFQKEVISGIEEVRRAELKARLSALDLTASWYEFGAQSALLKSLVGVAVATLIGSGVYYYADKEEAREIINSAPHPESIALDWVIKPATVSINPSKDEGAKPTPIATKPASPVKEENVAVPSRAVFIPDFTAPEADGDETERAPVSAALETLPSDPSTKTNSVSIDIATEITKSLEINYKYYDGKLFLSGDFDKDPYEILEINAADGHRIYVKYLDKYYQVEITDQLSPLPKITDPNVIEELKLLRLHK